MLGKYRWTAGIACALASWALFNRALSAQEPPTQAPIVAPPAIAIRSRNGVPTGAQNDFGSFTAPHTDRNLSVTAYPCSARCTLYSVSTLIDPWAAT